MGQTASREVGGRGWRGNGKGRRRKGRCKYFKSWTKENVLKIFLLLLSSPGLLLLSPSFFFLSFSPLNFLLSLSLKCRGSCKLA